MVLSDGQEIYCREYNSGTSIALLLVHGGPGDGSVSFGRLIEELQKNFRVIEVDQRGCGRSAWEQAEKISLRRILEDYEEIRRYYGIQRWFLLGHSFGGYLALFYAALYPRPVSGLILENPAIDLTDSIRCILRNYVSFFENWGDEAEVKRLKEMQESLSVSEGLRVINGYPNHIRSEFWGIDRLPPEGLRQLFKVQDIPEYGRKLMHFANALSLDSELEAGGWGFLQAVACPILLLYGEWDHITDPEIRFRFLVGAEYGQIQKIDGCGHYIHLGRTETMCEVMTGFIRETEE